MRRVAIPVLLEALQRGELHLTATHLLAPHLTVKNCEEWIRAASHRTGDQIRRLIADHQPRPDVRASIRSIPERVPAAARLQPRSGPGNEPRTFSHEDATEPERSLNKPPVAGSGATTTLPTAEDPALRTRAEPLGRERYCIRFTADRALYQQLHELRALMRHQVPDGDLAKILARAVANELTRVRKQKLAACEKPRTSGHTPNPGASSRHIPAEIRRAVWKRDRGRCTYQSGEGRRCGARGFLEFDHRNPWARSHRHAADAIRLRCRAHNQQAARRDFGERHMARFTGKTADRGNVSPGTESAQLDLDPVENRSPPAEPVQPHATPAARPGY